MLPAATTNQSVTGTLTALPANTTIYYRVVATNSAGESDGAVESFKTSSQSPAPVRTATATLGNQRITLTTPSTAVCTANSSKLAVTLSSTTIKHSNKAKLKFTNAVIYIDKGVKHTVKKTVRRHGKQVKVTVTVYRANASVKRLPASPKLKLSAVRSGRHTLRVTLSYVETVTKHGHKVRETVTKALTVTFKVC